MSSSTPPEGPHGPETPDDAFEPEPDDDDTGPVQVYQPPPAPEPEWGPAPHTWAGRFDAPLTVTPKQIRRQRNPKMLLIGVALVVAVAVVGSLVYWMSRPSSDAPVESTATTTAVSPSPEKHDKLLMQQLPDGYAADACESATPPSKAVAEVNCGRNTDPGGPLTATYTLVEDKATLNAVFDEAVRAANRVDCPGNIQSPGPWRRNATPERVSGMLYCGLRDGEPTVVWTDDDKLMLNSVRSGPQGPTFPQLYAWWSSHS